MGKSNIILASMIFVGVLLIGFAVWKGMDDEPVKETKLGKGLAADREILENPNAKDRDIYLALLRLGKKRDPFALEQALQRAASTSNLIRSACAEAAGNFESTDAMSLIEKMMDDPERTVRLRAIRGLGFRRGENRKQMLEHLLDREISLDEKVEAYAALARISPGEEGGSLAIEELVAMASEGSGPKNSRAAFKAASIAPRDERVIGMLKEKVEKQDGAVMVTGIKHLSAVGNGWIRTKLPELAAHQSPSIRVAVIDSIPMACPKAAMHLVEVIVKDSQDPIVLRSGINSFISLGGGKAEVNLELLINSGLLTKDLMKIAQRGLSNIRRFPQKGACQRAAKPTTDKSM